MQHGDHECDMRAGDLVTLILKKLRSQTDPFSIRSPGGFTIPTAWSDTLGGTCFSKLECCAWIFLLPDCTRVCWHVSTMSIFTKCLRDLHFVIRDRVYLVSDSARAQLMPTQEDESGLDQIGPQLQAFIFRRSWRGMAGRRHMYEDTFYVDFFEMGAQSIKTTSPTRHRFHARQNFVATPFVCPHLPRRSHDDEGLALILLSLLSIRGFGPTHRKVPCGKEGVEAGMTTSHSRAGCESGCHLGRPEDRYAVAFQRIRHVQECAGQGWDGGHLIWRLSFKKGLTPRRGAAGDRHPTRSRTCLLCRTTGWVG
jgi:hypothetical protein